MEVKAMLAELKAKLECLAISAKEITESLLSKEEEELVILEKISGRLESMESDVANLKKEVKKKLNDSTRSV